MYNFTWQLSSSRVANLEATVDDDDDSRRRESRREDRVSERYRNHSPALKSHGGEDRKRKTEDLLIFG